MRRLGLGVECKQKAYCEQPNLFTEEIKEIDPKEKKQIEMALAIKKKYGKNILLRASDLEEGATAKTRNNQIGGHNA